MSSQNASILLVDDDEDICGNMADIFNDLGYHVDVAHNGPSALILARKRLYDVVLLDFRMPGMDGLTLYREIKKVQAGAVAFLVTAYASAVTSREAMSAGMSRILPKPVELPALLSLIEGALEQPLILVVDDDPDLCGTLWDLLRDRGYRVSLAHDGRGAAEQLRGSPRVVLIDMKLPDSDGFGVFHQVRDVSPDARTVLITAHRAEMEPLVEQLRTEGVDAICYKPFDIPELLDTLGKLAHD